MLSVTHNTKVESTFLHFNWLQVWLLYCPQQLLATGVSKYKLQEHHMLEKQLFLTILARCQSFCPVHFWVLCEILSSSTFLLCFCCVIAVQTKTTNTWIPKYLQLEKNSERIARVPIFLAMTLHKMWPFKWARHPNVSQVSLIEESMKKQCQTIIIIIMWPQTTARDQCFIHRL